MVFVPLAVELVPMAKAEPALALARCPVAKESMAVAVVLVPRAIEWLPEAKDPKPAEMASLPLATVSYTHLTLPTNA